MPCLGAAALGDIGRHFPDTDVHGSKVRGFACVLLQEAARRVQAAGWRIGNL
jgi:2-C-methyl-D-erythritol 2,4-cyclodiphosphate synthase